jgi:hypothetical protein
MRAGVAKVLAALLALWTAILPATATAAASDFANWAAVVVAGDFHAHSGGPTEAFDNARRDVTAALERAGFQDQNIQQFSVRPENYPGQRLLPSKPSVISGSLQALARKATDGCLVYFSSHGNPSGILVGDNLFSPAGLSQMVDDACGARPTVVILSACYSGVFLPAVSDANRVVLTAARPDRSSFGCSESDKYPYFDDCILSSFPHVGDFGALGQAARVCVSNREAAEHLAPASEPQMSLGAAIRPLLPFYAFSKN